MEITRTPPSGDIVTAGPVAATTPVGEVYRDITRGGLAGLMVGIVLAGVGGRLVMRLAALLQPGAAGMATENGNIIGRITLEGSLALVVFIGLFVGAVAGSLWVVIRPWLPTRSMARAVAAVPIAIAFGTTGLVDAGNLDFVVLRRDSLVIGSLVALVGLFGPALVLTDRWLEGLLPHPGPNDTRILGTYAGVTILGTLLTLFLVDPDIRLLRPPHLRPGPVRGRSCDARIVVVAGRASSSTGRPPTRRTQRSGRRHARGSVGRGRRSRWRAAARLTAQSSGARPAPPVRREPRRLTRRRSRWMRIPRPLASRPDGR